ncbi:MAG: ATP-binding protein [Bacteroidales bacterium]
MSLAQKLRRFVHGDRGLRFAVALLYLLVIAGGVATLSNLKAFRDGILTSTHQRISGVAATLAQHLPDPLDTEAESSRLAPLFAGFGEQTVVAVIDRRHGVLVSLPPSRHEAQLPPEALERLDGGGNGRFIAPWPDDGINRLWGYATTDDGRDLAVLVGVPQSMVASAVTQLAWHLTALFAALAGGAVLLAFLLHHLRMRRRVEAELREKSRAAVVASEAKTAFLANMSHELRTPLTGVLGMAELMAGTRLDREQSDMLGTIRISAQTLLTVLDDVLDFSRMEAGDLKLVPADVDLHRLSADTVRLLRPAAAAKGLRLEEDIAAGCPPWVRTDPSRLQQVLLNLIGNAIKFTETGGVTLRVWPEGARICFAIEDTGIGMGADTLARLFTPFTQADDSNTRRHGGAGMGLAIAKRLVGLMGGSLTASSAPGRGSLFQFSLLLPPGLPQPETMDPVRMTASRPLRVLLAEDNPVNQTLLMQLLQKMGHAATLAENGAEALELAAEQDFDVVLMDMQMPVMDGETATRLIRRLPGARADTPVVALTADAIPEHHARYVAAGLNAFLTKPVPAEILAHTLDEVTAGGKASATLRQVPTAPAACEAEATDAPVLDGHYLEDMRQWVGDSALLTLLATAPDSFNAELASIQAAWREGNAVSARENAHRLKGAAGSVGCRRLAELAQQIQKLNPSDLGDPGLLGRLEGEVAAAIAATSQWRPAQPAA